MLIRSNQMAKEILSRRFLSSLRTEPRRRMVSSAAYVRFSRCFRRRIGTERFRIGILQSFETFFAGSDIHAVVFQLLTGGDQLAVHCVQSNRSLKEFSRSRDEWSYFKTAVLVRITFFVTSSRTDSQFWRFALTKRIFIGSVNGSPFRKTLPTRDQRDQKERQSLTRWSCSLIETVSRRVLRHPCVEPVEGEAEVQQGNLLLNRRRLANLLSATFVLWLTRVCLLRCRDNWNDRKNS